MTAFPSGAHPFGVDAVGRDFFSRNVYAIRVSLAIGLGAALISALIGIPLGAVAGFYGGKTDWVVSRLLEVFQVIPPFMIAILLSTLSGGGLVELVLIISFTSWMGPCRLVRADVFALREEDFVLAARALGVGQARIIIRHLLPNALGPIIVAFSLTVPAAIIVEAGLSRFAVVYQSHDADPVGPVRSIRPSDPAIVKPLNPLFAYSGGTTKFINGLHGAGIADVGVDAAPGAYYRGGGRAAPHNLYSSTQALYRSAKTPGAAPVPLFTYSDPKLASVPAGSAPASHLTVAVGDQQTNYDWDAAAHTWKRAHDATPHLTDAGAQIAPTNVIVQFVQYKASPGDTDAALAQKPASTISPSSEVVRLGWRLPFTAPRKACIP